MFTYSLKIILLIYQSAVLSVFVRNGFPPRPHPCRTLSVCCSRCPISRLLTKML
jgi:hypothetical protein